MINQVDHKLWFAANGLLRLGYAKCGKLWGGNYPLVNEYPKSGGSWLAQMLADLLEIPFPRNRLPMLAGSQMLHGHYAYSNKFNNVCIVWRDGRDIMVSWYFHKIMGNELTSAKATTALGKYFGFDDVKDIESNLPKFIEYSFTNQHQPKFSWSEFVEGWYNKSAFHTKYEQLLVEPHTELRRALEWLQVAEVPDERIIEVVDKYSFSSQSGRSAGKESTGSYLRKGISGDWLNCFSQESKEIFCHYAGDHLIKLDYEKDKAWVKG